MLHFDVLKEPWIPVRTSGGETEMLSLNDTLARAQELMEIACDSPLETYAVQRLLIAYLMDAYGLETVYERKALFKRGRFDTDVLERYEKECRREGVTFDLFDEERPFMQAPKNVRIREGYEPDPAAELFHSLPTGISHIHFEHRTENMHAFTPAECLRGLLASYVFAFGAGRGYHASINGGPCCYVLVSGKNAFETLVLNMLSKREWKREKWDAPSVSWRRNDFSDFKKEFFDTSLLRGLTWLSRRITLLPEADGSIRHIMWDQGDYMNRLSSWVDPHVPYIPVTNGVAPLRASMGREAWRNLGAIATTKDEVSDGRVPITMQNAPRILDADSESYILNLIVFSLVMDPKKSAKKLDMYEEKLDVPYKILTTAEFAERLRFDLLYIEKVAIEIGKAAYMMDKVKDTKRERTKEEEKEISKKERELPSNLDSEAKMLFLAQMRNFLYEHYLAQYIHADPSIPGWHLPFIESINREVKTHSMMIVLAYADRMGTSARDLQAQTNTIRAFERTLNKLMKARLEE